MNVGLERFFQGGHNSAFFHKKPNIFFHGAKTGEILFYPLEIKKTTFFAKKLIGKCQISKCREVETPPLPPPPFRRP